MIDVKTASMGELVAYYNAHSGKSPIKKFADRATAMKRVAALVPAAKPKAKRPGFTTTKVEVNGKEYGSVKQAFTALHLPLGRHIRFRMALKAAGKLDFEYNTKTYAFKVAK
jgi:hypothetical protein